MSNLTRRAFTALGLGMASVAMLRTPAVAMTQASAKLLVEKVVDDINAIISSGQSENAMIRRFETVFSTYGDVETIARYTLGVDARSMGAADLRRYTDVFQGYMARKYGKRFREFIGGEITVEKARKVKSFIEVRTEVRLRGSSPFDVTFMVSDRGGSEKFFNMYIEGVNLLLTERSEIQAMLDARRGNVDKLIQDLAKTG